MELVRHVSSMSIPMNRAKSVFQMTALEIKSCLRMELVNNAVQDAIAKVLERLPHELRSMIKKDIAELGTYYLGQYTEEELLAMID